MITKPPSQRYYDHFPHLTLFYSTNPLIQAQSHFKLGNYSQAWSFYKDLKLVDWKDIWMCTESLVRIARFDEVLKRFGNLEIDFETYPEFKGEFCLWRARAYLAVHRKEKATENLILGLQIDKWNVNIWQTLVQEQIISEKELETIYKTHWSNCLLDSSYDDMIRGIHKSGHQNDSIESLIMSPKTPLRTSGIAENDTQGHNHVDYTSLLENETVIGLNIGLMILRDQTFILQKLEKEFNPVFQTEHVQWKLAKWLLKQERYDQAYSIASKYVQLNDESISKLVSMTREHITIYLTCLVQLKKKDELFFIGHNLVERHGHLSESWFAVGCYYYCIESYIQAEKYFKKAIGMDESFLDSWLTLGHVLSYKDDSEQALQAYRTSHKLFPGAHSCVLCLGMEYAKTNNLLLAEKFVLQARDMCESSDPLVHNELGVIKYKLQEFSEALHHFLYALSLKPTNQISTPDQWSTIHFNMGHCYRKLERYTEAIHHYTESLSLRPNDGSIYCAIGFTYHLSGKIDKAIEYYHHSLGHQCDDQHLASELLSRALKAIGRLKTDEIVPLS